MNTKIPEYKFDDNQLALTFDIFSDPVLVHPLLEEGFGFFTHVNIAARDRYGYSLEEFKKLTASDINISPEFTKYSTKSNRTELKQQQKRLIVSKHICKEGVPFPVEISSNIISLNGKLMIISIVRDLSERLKDQTEIADKTDMLDGVYRAAPIGIGVVSSRMLTEVNSRFCEMIGRQADELVGKSSRVIYPSDADYEKAGKAKYDQIRKSGTGSVETRLIKKDGNIIDVILSSTPIDIEDFSKGVIFTALDITSRKTQEKELKLHKENLENLVLERTHELKAMNEELTAVNEELQIVNDQLFSKNKTIREQKNELKENITKLQETQEQLIQTEKMASLGILTAGIAHEINNPLNFIKGGHNGLVSFFNASDCEINEETSFFLNSIDEGIERAAKIVSGLNQYSRDNDSLEERCNIHLIMTNCMQILYNAYKTRIEIKADFTSKEILIKGNVGKLYQVFTNIINNAIDAINEQGNIIIKTWISNNKAYIEFKDDGYGISELNMKKICDPFFTTKDPGKGTGLGLSISKRIIEDHQGKLKFTSVENKGTTVIIELPLNEENL